MLVDLRVTQLLCSRLCHDLVGPAGGVAVGLEILSEHEDHSDEAQALIERGAGQMTECLTFYRAAFGIGGLPGGRPVIEQARRLSEVLLAGSAVALDWPDGPAAPASVSPKGCKLLLNLILLGRSALPRGGTLGVHCTDLPDGAGMAVMAGGAGARLGDDLRAALAPDPKVEALNAQNVQAYYTRLLAADMGAAIEWTDNGGGEVRLATLVAPDGGPDMP